MPLCPFRCTAWVLVLTTHYAHKSPHTLTTTTTTTAMAEHTFDGELLAMVDPRNEPSQNVIGKLGFAFWKEAVVGGYLDGIYRRRVGGGT